MFEVVNFDSWNVYDGFAEGSGRSEKVWLRSENNTIGLFKYPKIDPADQKVTTEHISEHLAHQLGVILNVPTATVDIGVRDGRIGSMSYLVLRHEEALMEGINFISGRYPQYNADKMQDEATGKYYCIEHILTSVPSFVPNRIWIEMMLFDFLIGNRDRHQSNWALLLEISVKDQIKIQFSQCPLYDNGSSLCCYINESQVDTFMGNDIQRFQSLVDSKSRSVIRIDGSKKAMPTHSEVVRYLLSKYPVARTIAERFIECLDESMIHALMDQYPEDILSPKKNVLIRRFLLKKVEILKSLKMEADQNVTVE